MGTPMIPSVDSDTKQFPDSVRSRIAANLTNATTPEGAAVASLVGQGGSTSVGTAVPTFTPPVPYSVAAWGDSVTEIGIGSDSWPERLAQATGLPVYNGGKWGQSSPQVAARQGGAPAMLTFPSFTLPSGTAAVTVTADVNPLGGSYSGSRAGSVHGIAGTLAWDQPTNALTFTRATNGPTAVFSGAVKFIPADGTRTANREAIQIFWVGRNGAQDVTGNIAAIRKMVAYGNARFLVFSILPWSGQLSPDVSNYAYIEAFPEQFRDVTAWLQTTAAASAAGITFTTDDQTDIAAGLVPRSFRQDDVHPNANGRAAIAAFAASELQKLGWATLYTAPALPTAATNRWDLSGRGPGQQIASVTPLVGSVALTQGTVANQPTGVADALFKRNPALVGATSIGGALSAVPSVATVTLVGRLTDATDANGKLFANLFGVLLRVNGTKFGTYATSGGAAIASTTTADTAPHVITAVLNGANAALWIDGVKVGTGTAAPSSIQITLGGGAGFEVLDVVYNDSALSDANVTATATALRNGYVK